ncbi:MAG: SWIM zinc finger family protein [Isosphaeraceae bacterium]|nr:SWIM zinc finger family protein [Isosphaeraceae bacterium]
MGTVWSTEQILALAPDAGSAKSGRELATTRKWVTLAFQGETLWGECQGSGAKPYQTKVALEGPAFHCSCPSRKFPCKHALGLFLLWTSQSSALPQAEPPPWVASWLEGRAQRVEQKAKKEQERQEKRDKGEPTTDVTAQKKREMARWAKVTAGVDDLGVWIGDLVRHGLVTVQGKASSLWEDQARRLIDAQAPGLARRLRQMEGIPLSGDGWQEPLLDRLARIHLAVEGCRRFDTLAPELRDELRGVLGLPVDQDSIRALPGVRDVWQVVGQRVESEDRLRTQRTWLLGRETGRPALVLDFAYGNSQPLDATLPAGSQIDAELTFFPGTVPLRALVKVRYSPLDALEAPKGYATIPEAYAAYAVMLGRSPWMESIPLVLHNVQLSPRGETWLVRDAIGRVLPLAPRFALGWACLGLSGGQPLTLAAEFNGATLEPLACWLDGRFCRLATDSSEMANEGAPPLAAPGGLANLWRETAASALVGTERRRPPPSPQSAPFRDSVTGLDLLDPPAQLLGLAACVTQYIRVGHEPPIDPGAPPEPCPGDDRPECGPALAERLRRMLAGEHATVLREWLSLVGNAGLRVSSDRIAELLALARRQTELRDPLRDALGKRGRWLAALNPDWGYVGGTADQVDPESIWETGTRAERLVALRALRSVAPARGRELLASTWGSETADDRAAFVETLAVGLEPDDEPFLEAALDDRGKSVRREAAELLARIPGSRFALRMAERSALLLTWDGSRLSVEPPVRCDLAMVRDGLVAKPPSGVGERAWWLRQLVAASPLSSWEGVVGLPASVLVAAAMETEWALDLWLSWGRATVRTGDPAWGSALLQCRPTALDEDNVLGQLLAVLAPEERDAYLLRLLEAHAGPLRTDHPVWPLIRGIDSAIGDGFGEALLRRLRETVAHDEALAPRPRYDYELTQFLARLGGILPIRLAVVVDQLWPRDDSERTYYGPVAEQMKSLLHFRHDMCQEFVR